MLFRSASPAFSESENPSGIAFDTPGYQVLSLTVTDANGQTNSTIDSVFVKADAAPTIGINPDDLSCLGSVNSFEGTITGSTAASWDWDMGDGTLLSGQNITHT